MSDLGSPRKRGEAAETFPPIEFIRDELDARGWTERDLFARIPDEIDRIALDFLLHVTEKGLLVGKELSAALGVAFDVSPEYFLNLDRAWQPEEYARYEARQAQLSANEVSGPNDWRRM